MVTLMSKVTFFDLEILRPAISLRMWCFLNSCNKEGRGGNKQLKCNFCNELDSLIHCGQFAHFMLRFTKWQPTLVQRLWDSGETEIAKCPRIWRKKPAGRRSRGWVSKAAWGCRHPQCSRWLDLSGWRSTLDFAEKLTFNDFHYCSARGKKLDKVIPHKSRTAHLNKNRELKFIWSNVTSKRFILFFVKHPFLCCCPI